MLAEVWGDEREKVHGLRAAAGCPFLQGGAGGGGWRGKRGRDLYLDPGPWCQIYFGMLRQRPKKGRTPRGQVQT